MIRDDQLALLEPECRLALSYATGRAKPLFLGLFAVDTKLASIVRGAREPMLGQLKLAWWREQLAKPSSERASGEPLLGTLADWDAARHSLSGLADGWEHLLGDAPLPETAIAGFAEARGQACAALAGLLNGNQEEARRAGYNWALSELAARVTDHDERQAIMDLASRQDWHIARLERDLRPLLVLHGLAARSWSRGFAPNGPGAILSAIRLGMLGF